MVRLIDRPDMTLDVYRGRKTTIQQQLYFLLLVLVCSATRQAYDVVLMLMRRHHVASTSIRRHFNVVCPLRINCFSSRNTTFLIFSFTRYIRFTRQKIGMTNCDISLNTDKHHNRPLPVFHIPQINFVLVLFEIVTYSMAKKVCQTF